MHISTRMLTRGFTILLLVFTFLPFNESQPAIPAASAAQSVDTAYLVLKLDSPGPAQFLSTSPARQMMRELEQMRSTGRIRDYLIHPEDATVEVRGAGQATVDALAKMPGVQGTSREKRTGCERQAASIKQSTSADIERVKDPIEIRLDEYAIEEHPQASRWIRGWVAPNTLLYLEIWHGETLVYETDGTSQADGFYSFSPQYEDTCFAKGGEWMVYPGDRVRLTAGSQVYTTTAASIVGWMDRRTGKIQGVLPPGRKMEAEVYHTSLSCWVSPNYQWFPGQEQPEGRFIIPVPELSFDQSAFVYAREAQGSTYIYFEPINFFVPTNENYGVAGYFLPSTDTTITLERGSTILKTVNVMTAPSGRFNASFGMLYLPGDRITASGGGESMSYTVAPLSASFNRANGTITGTALPGYHVSIQYRFGGPQSTCAVDYNPCLWATAGADGTFSIPAPNEWTNGYFLMIASYDPQGSYQNGTGDSHPSIFISKTTLGGQFFSPGDRLTIDWQDPQGRLIRTFEKTVNDDGRFSQGIYGGENGGPAAGDRLIVHGSGYVGSITFHDLKLRLSSKSGKLEGSAPPGWLEAWAFRHDPVHETWSESCLESATNGAFSLEFASFTVRPNTYSRVYFIDPDRNLTETILYSFEIGVIQEKGEVFGMIETGPATSSFELWRQGRLLGKRTVEYPGTDVHSYTVNLGTPILAGDRLIVNSGDGIVESLDVPLLEAHGGPIPSQAAGRAPANQPFLLSVTRKTDGNPYSQDWLSKTITSGPDGSFTADLSDKLWTYSDCNAFWSGNPCNQYHITYATPENYQIYYDGPLPPPAAPDPYEPDNTAQLASVYTGKQVHTQHSNDAVDWIRFNVSETEVQLEIPFVFTISHIGINSGIAGELRDPDNQTIALGGTISKQQELVTTHVFTKPGQYLLALRPEKLYAAGNCYAGYELDIHAAYPKIFLPVMGR